MSKRKELHRSLHSLMDQALNAELGIEIQTSDASHLKQELNFARRGARELGISDYDILMFRTCPTDPETRVWIVKKVSMESA